MKLRFVLNNRILQITKASSEELEALQEMSTVSWIHYNGKKRKKCSTTYLHNWQYLPGGFWHKVAAMRTKGYHVEIENIAEFVQSVTLDEITEWIGTVPLKEKYVPRWYQVRGIWLAIKYRISRGEFATSAGKSLILYLLARYLFENEYISKDKKILIVVPSVMLVNQMHDDFAEYQEDNYLQVDRIFGGSKRNKEANVVVGNIDSLVNYDLDFFSQFDAVFFDEAHKLKTAQYKEVLSFMHDNKFSCIYSVSGTFYGPKEPEEFAAESISGPILFRVPAKLLMDEGSITPAKIKMVYLEYSREISEMYYNHEDCQDAKLRQHFETKFLKDLFCRRELIRKLTDKIEFNQLLLFRSKAHCKLYHDVLTEKLQHKTVVMIHGDISSAERERIKILTENNMNVIICATYATMSTGVSIKNLSTLHLIDGSKSFIWVRQSIGRTLRLHHSKKFAMIFDYVDIFKKWDGQWLGLKHSSISVKHAKHRKQIYTKQQFDMSEVTVQLS